MKVCHLVSGDLWAGAEVQAYQMMRGLRDRGGVEVSAILLNEGRLAEALRGCGVFVTVIDEKHLGFPQVVWRVKRLLSDLPPDVLHTHRYKENLIGAMLKRPCGVSALVQTVHGLSEPFQGLRRAKMAVYQWVNRLVRRGAFERVIGVSEQIAGMLRAEVGKERVAAIHNAIDIAPYAQLAADREVRNELGISPEQVLIGGVGRLVPVKNFELFLRVAAGVLSQCPHAVFVIAGDGPDEAALKARAEELKLGERMKFLGFRNDVERVYSALDIFLNTSRHEGIPMSILEVMAMRKAVVATRVGGVPEIIEAGVSGLLCESGDEAGITAAVVKLVSDASLRQTLGETAAIRISQEYSLERMIERLLAVYHEALGSVVK